MPGSDRILDSVSKMLEGEAKIRSDIAAAVLKGQTQRQILQGQLKFGMLKGLAETHREAQDLHSEAETMQPAPQPFQLDLGSAIAESRVNPREPLQAVDPAQFSGVIQGLGAGAATPNPAATQGLPVAGPEIQQRSQTVGLSPERVGQQGFVLVPQISQRTDSVPNALTAQDLLRARMDQSQHQDRITLERLKADREENSRQFLNALQARKALIDTAEIARQQGFSPQESVELQEAVRIGDKEAIGRLTAGRKTLADKAVEAEIRLRDAEAQYHNTQAKQLGFKLTPGEEAADKKYGEFVGGISANGGFERARTNVGILKMIQKELENGEPLTGPALATIGRPGRLAFNPESEDRLGMIGNVIRGSARQILEDRYTAEEADALVRGAYDIGLSPEKNAARLSSFIGTMEKQIQENEDRYTYFGENHTLKGFKGTLGKKTSGGVDLETGPAPSSLSGLSDAELDAQIAAAKKAQGRANSR